MYKMCRDLKQLKSSSLVVVEVIEVFEIVLVQCNLVDNEYQRKSEVFCTFIPNKSYTYLLNVETSNLVFLKIYDRTL